MKTIAMEMSICMHDGWHENGTRNFKCVSRWKSIKHNYKPNKRNQLWDYVEDENGYNPYSDKFNAENGLYLDYFEQGGKKYALEQFYALGNPFYCPYEYSYTDEEGKIHPLAGVDSDCSIFEKHPLFIELDEYAENVRCWMEVD